VGILKSKLSSLLPDAQTKFYFAKLMTAGAVMGDWQS